MADEIDIKSYREAMGETQAEFARHFDVDQATIHRWEVNGLPDRGAARMAVERYIREHPIPTHAEEIMPKREAR